MTAEAYIKLSSLIPSTDMNPNFVFPAIESRKPTPLSSHQRASLPAIARRLSAQIVSTPAKALDKVEQNLKQVKEIVDPRRTPDSQNTSKHRRFASSSILPSSTPNVRACINRRFSRQHHQRSESNDGSLRSSEVVTPLPSSPKFLGRGLYANIPTNSDGFSGGLPDFKSHVVLRKASGQFNYPVPCTSISSLEETSILSGTSVSKPQLLPKSPDLHPEITSVQTSDNLERKIERSEVEPVYSRKATPAHINTRSASPSSVNIQEERYQPLRYHPPSARRPSLVLKVSSVRPQTAQGMLERMNNNQENYDRNRLSTVSSVYSSDWREDILSEYEDQNETSSIPSSGSIFPNSSSPSSSPCLHDQTDLIYKIDESNENTKRDELMNSLELELGEVYHFQKFLE